MNTDTQQQLERLVDALENQEQPNTDIQRSFLTQPERIFITSDDDISQQSSQDALKENSFAQFTVNLKRPALNVKSLQVSRVSIPNATTSSIPDDECVFWYYRIPAAVIAAGQYYPNPTGLLSPTYLYYVRLLPTSYKKEFLDPAYSSLYGYNSVFPDYESLSSELVKACQNDLLYDQRSFYTWNALQIYGLGFPVSFNNIWYVSLQSGNVGNNPAATIGVWWNIYLQYIPNDVTISYNSQTNRFILTGNNAVVASIPQYFYLSAGYNDTNIKQASDNLNIITIVRDIPGLFNNTGQQSKLYKTLNLRLGFTFDGNTNFIRPAGNLGTVGNKFFTLLNRFRPVPYYDPPFESITAVPAVYTFNRAISYTAECPANLVYTSIVNFYADIAGGSTSDSSEQGQALLATVQMAAGTLGVVFYNPTIYNALTKISDQIYQITVEMRTENGNLFYLPNSAIVTLEFTLTY
jgi:hypothetical protein